MSAITRHVKNHYSRERKCSVIHEMTCESGRTLIVTCDINGSDDKVKMERSR